MVVLLIAGIALAVWQLCMLVVSTAWMIQGRSVNIGVAPGILSVIFFALYFLL